MTGKRFTTAIIIAGLMSAWTARASATGALSVNASAGNNTIEVTSLLGKLKDTLGRADATPEDIKEKASFLDYLNGVRLNITNAVKGWATPSARPAAPPEVAGLIGAAQKTVDRSPVVPPLDLKESFDFSKSMAAEDRVHYGGLGQWVLGEYDYVKDKLGEIKLNSELALLATKVGFDFAYATVIHEATHALDHAHQQLHDAEVIAGEISAFLKQYLWLKFVDPLGQKLPRLLANLEKEYKLHREQVTADAIQYLHTLWDLFWTEGKLDKIEAFAKALGYEEGARGRELNGAPSA